MNTASKEALYRELDRVSELTGLSLSVEWSDDGETGCIVECLWETGEQRRWSPKSAAEPGDGETISFQMSPWLGPEALHEWLYAFLLGFDAGCDAPQRVPWRALPLGKQLHELRSRKTAARGQDGAPRWPAGVRSDPRAAGSPRTTDEGPAGGRRAEGPSPAEVQAWVDAVLRALYAAECWFRRGLPALEIADRAGLSPHAVFAACRAAVARGQIEIVGLQRGKGTLYSLTPQGVALVQKMDPFVRAVR
ncbi:MAG: MarR family winged helix-turn-helix transcriptional regulator [Armatimonadota bacterium]|nr:MarR family winged helix-turn-helix transcriptional regulator [Armatimonadota bacterium]MDR7532947.1 MarR family winged helix-turn-helix transcriptional regulator [Armatimonadota bacterium]MDR7536405.1 MarR family winged helix-turn-helix transcriptional regulator [Armatimonadota bacterium]